MNSQFKIERVEFFSDPRGWVIDPIPNELLSAQRHVHVVLTEPGGIRGNHYHERSTEVFTVMGSALVRIRESGRPRDIDVPEGQAFRFTIPPGMAHAIQNTGPRQMVLMSFSTLPYNRAHPDAVIDVLIQK